MAISLVNPVRPHGILSDGSQGCGVDGLDMTPDTPNHIDAKVSISSELSPNPKHETKLSRASIPASEPRVSVAKLLPELGQISNKRVKCHDAYNRILSLINSYVYSTV